MTTESTTANTKERASSVIYFGSLYFITVGALYLWGYWSPFGINILEYLPLADVIKTTAYPIATVALLTGIGAALGEVLVSPIKLPPGGGRDTKVGKILRRVGPALSFIYILGTVLLAIYGPVEKWHVLPILLAVPVYQFAKHKNFLLAVIPHESPRSIVIFMLAVLPFMAYARGTLAADWIQSGKKFFYAVSEVPGYSSTPGTSPSDLPRFVGRAGEFMFFFDPTNEVVVIAKIESGKALALKKLQVSSATSPAGSNPSLKGTAAGKPASAP